MSDPVLNHERLTARAAEPEGWLYVLHGIYGAGRNWKTVARRTVEARPDWGALLVDLREHAGSRGFAPPHTLAAAAADLDDLARRTGIAPRAILGHSFGGKVALVYAQGHGVGPRQLWVVDSTPAARPPSGSAWEMLGVLRRVPDRFASRADAVASLEAEGVARPVAQWVSTNLDRIDDGYRWGIDLDAMEALLRDFFRTDAWQVVESPPPGLTIHFVKAERSSVLDDDACARIEAAARATGRVHLHHVAGGHWLNADNPDAVVAMLRECL